MQCGIRIIGILFSQNNLKPCTILDSIENHDNEKAMLCEAMLCEVSFLFQ